MTTSGLRVMTRIAAYALCRDAEDRVLLEVRLVDLADLGLRLAWAATAEFG